MLELTRRRGPVMSRPNAPYNETAMVFLYTLGGLSTLIPGLIHAENKMILIRLFCNEYLKVQSATMYVYACRC